MSAIVLRDLRARRPHHIGHRILAEGEVLCRAQFRSEDDAKFFFNHLRWSAFESVVVDNQPSAEPNPAIAVLEATIAKLTGTIAAKDQEIAELQSLVDADEPIVIGDLPPGADVDGENEADSSDAKPKPPKKDGKRTKG